MIPFKFALLFYFLVLTLAKKYTVWWFYYEYWPQGSQNDFVAYDDGVIGKCKSASDTTTHYFFLPVSSPQQTGMMLCVRKNYMLWNSAVINFKNVIEVYNFMAHHYVTSFPRTLKPVIPSSKTDTDSCLDLSGKITRDFENTDSCMVKKSYDMKKKQFLKYAGPNLFLDESKLEGLMFYIKQEDYYLFLCNGHRHGKHKELCDKAITTDKYVCGRTSAQLLRDLDSILSVACTVKLENFHDEVKYQMDKFDYSTQYSKLVYKPYEWCAFGRNNFKEELQYQCNHDFCNLEWYAQYKEFRDLKCQKTSNILAKLYQQCYLYYDFDASRVGVLNELVLASRSQVGDPYDPHYSYVIGTVRIGDHAICSDYMYNANNSKLLFFYQYRCSSDNCDNQTMEDTLKTKAEEKKLGLVCDMVNYVSENYYDYDDMHIYGPQIYNNTHREPGYICYVRVTRDKGKVNFQAGTIDTVEDLGRFCNSTYVYSPSSYFNETTKTMTCCTINMKNQQSDSNCTVENMFKLWREEMAAKDADSKDTSDKNVLICEKRNEKDEHCAFTGRCYSTRRVDNSHIGAPAGCTNHLDERILQNTAMVEYGLACLIPEAVGKCVLVNSYMSLNNTSSNEPLIACCCNESLIRKANASFGDYRCDTHVDELEEDMTTKIKEFSNE